MQNAGDPLSTGASREDSRYPENDLTLLMGLGTELRNKGTVPEELSLKLSYGKVILSQHLAPDHQIPGSPGHSNSFYRYHSMANL